MRRFVEAISLSGDREKEIEFLLWVAKTTFNIPKRNPISIIPFVDRFLPEDRNFILISFLFSMLKISI